MRALPALQAQHRALLRLVADIKKDSGESQCLLMTHPDSEANVAAANHVREGRVDHELQDPAPSTPGPLVGPGLLQLARNGDISNSHPFHGARHIIDESHSYRVKFVCFAKTANQRNAGKQDMN